MMNLPNLKVVHATISQATIECPHCNTPGQSYIPPVGVLSTTILGECPTCKALFLIKIEDQKLIDNTRHALGELIYAIIEDNKASLTGVLDARHQIQEALYCLPGIENLPQTPEFEITRQNTKIVIQAKNAEASNVLDTLKDLLPAKDDNNTIKGV